MVFNELCPILLTDSLEEVADLLSTTHNPFQETQRRISNGVIGGCQQVGIVGRITLLNNILLINSRAAVNAAIQKNVQLNFPVV